MDDNQEKTNDEDRHRHTKEHKEVEELEETVISIEVQEAIGPDQQYDTQESQAKVKSKGQGNEEEEHSHGDQVRDKGRHRQTDPKIGKPKDEENQTLR